MKMEKENKKTDYINLSLIKILQGPQSPEFSSSFLLEPVSWGLNVQRTLQPNTCISPSQSFDSKTPSLVLGMKCMWILKRLDFASKSLSDLSPLDLTTSPVGNTKMPKKKKKSLFSIIWGRTTYFLLSYSWSPPKLDSAHCPMEKVAKFQGKLESGLSKLVSSGRRLSVKERKREQSPGKTAFTMPFSHPRKNTIPYYFY